MKRTSTRRNRSGFLLGLPILDFMSVVIIFAVIVIIMLVLKLDSFVSTVSRSINQTIESIRGEIIKLKSFGPAGADHKIVPEPVGTLEGSGWGLFKKADELEINSQRLPELNELARKHSRDTLQNVSKSDAEFWRERAGELCMDPGQIPVPIQVPVSDSAADYIVMLHRLNDYRDRIWQLIVQCKEERIEVIDEHLLRFKFNKSTEFDMTPAAVEHAGERIKALVDLHRDERRIFVRGHCDLVGTDEYNYVLSYRRALFVADIINSYLQEKGLKEGIDFQLIMEGMGKSRPLPRAPYESEDEWHSRLRRIELAFQRMPLSRSAGVRK